MMVLGSDVAGLVQIYAHVVIAQGLGFCSLPNGAVWTAEAGLLIAPLRPAPSRGLLP